MFRGSRRRLPKGFGSAYAVRLHAISADRPGMACPRAAYSGKVPLQALLKSLPHQESSLNMQQCKAMVRAQYVLDTDQPTYGLCWTIPQCTCWPPAWSICEGESSMLLVSSARLAISS